AAALERPRAIANRRKKPRVDLSAAQSSTGTSVPPGDLALRVRHLSVNFPASGADYQPVAEVSFDVQRGEIVGIVGESGSGKSMMSSAITDLTPAGAVIIADHLDLSGNNLLEIRGTARDHVLGSMVAT